MDAMVLSVTQMNVSAGAHANSMGPVEGAEAIEGTALVGTFVAARGRLLRFWLASAQAGSAYNIIPDCAELKGTLRTFDPVSN